jgi:3-oxoacyl-[acyl-carrier-protein] synthase-3
MIMDGTKLFRLAVKKMETTLLDLLQENGTSTDEIDLFLFHQANLRILEAVLKRLKIPALKHYSTIGKFGNSSSSSLPIALDDATHTGKVKPGSKLALCTFGGGFTWAAALIDW